MDVQSITQDIVNRTRHIPGVVAIVLGGSRAKGTHTPMSDIDIGIYYDSPETFDIPALERIAVEMDDDRRANLLTGIGGWGPWVNGGGWLRIRQRPVDWIYREFNRVSTVIDQCLSGDVSIDYYPGHPHGFINAIYMAEIALCRILWESCGIISSLKEKTEPYPQALKQALIDKFMWEASFSLKSAGKSVFRRDVYHAAGSCFRTVSCLNQTLFALNEQYWMNESGALDIADTFHLAPDRYKDRVNEAFLTLEADSSRIQHAIRLFEGIVKETEELVGSGGIRPR